MGLGLTRGGDFAPWIKYDARAGRWFRKGEGDEDQVDITNDFAAVFDFDQVEVGWIIYAEGVQPLYHTQDISLGVPNRPEGSAKWKQGFRLMIALPGRLGGGVFEVSSTAFAFIEEIDRLHTVYSEAKAANPGKLPVLKMSGTTAVETKTKEGGKSRNYRPNLEIAAWVDRPATLPLKDAKPAAPAALPATEGPKPETKPAAQAPAAKSTAEQNADNGFG